MSYLKFDKTLLVNLEYSLPKEVLQANELGVYSSSTIVGCNTRKYHGLLVVPVKEIDGGRHVLLSNLHETVIQHDQKFNLGINKYPGEYSPKGHKYARWFETDPVIKMVYRVGGVVLQKEIILDDSKARVYVRYTLLEAHSPTKIQLKPFMAFRSIHSLSHANMYASIKSELVPNGFKYRMYHEYPEIFLQTSKKANYIPAPDWYYEVEYSKEKVRGYDYHEDLFVPGFFEFNIRKGESVVLTAGVEQMPANQISKSFQKQYDRQSVTKSFEDLLVDSSKKFIQLIDGVHEIISGFPWFGRWGRNPIIALPGLLLAQKEYALAEEILLGMVRQIRNGLFPDHSPNATNPNYRAVDTGLWMIWAIQKYTSSIRNKSKANSLFGQIIKEIIHAYSNGLVPGVSLHSNGLLYAFEHNIALTWMDSYAHGHPVTQRPGYVVEINTLWFHALSFAKELSVYEKGSEEGKHLDGLIKQVRDSFNQVFWNESKGSLADYVFEGKANWDIRPNMVFATALKYSPLGDEQKKKVLDLVRLELLTPKGLRTLSPRSEQFKYSYEGDHYKRDMAYHQGTVWPWLFGFFAEGWIKLHGDSGKEFIRRIYNGFEEDMMEHGLRNISEVYDGSPPHRACGAIAFAPSVAELLRVVKMLSK